MQLKEFWYHLATVDLTDNCKDIAFLHPPSLPYPRPFAQLLLFLLILYFTKNRHFFIGIKYLRILRLKIAQLSSRLKCFLNLSCLPKHLIPLVENYNEATHQKRSNIFLDLKTNLQNIAARQNIRNSYKKSVYNVSLDPLWSTNSFTISLIPRESLCQKIFEKCVINTVVGEVMC